jgi:phospho-N-acetylmuramoyl-pentapeptide-transferase
MLLWLAQYFQDYVGPMRIFNYITFRAVFATITAIAIGLLCGPAVIRKLTALKVGQAVRPTVRRPTWPSTAPRPWAAC